MENNHMFVYFWRCVNLYFWSYQAISCANVCKPVCPKLDDLTSWYSKLGADKTTIDCNKNYNAARVPPRHEKEEYISREQGIVKAEEPVGLATYWKPRLD